MAKRLTLKSLEERISNLMKKEDRKDVEFRLAIALSEFGDIAKYITHDPKLNPNARPHGSKKDEVLAYGQLLCQIIAVQNLRGIPLKDAIKVGLENWEDADWRRSKASGEGITGISAVPGTATAYAYVVSEENPIENYIGGILVTKYATPDIVNHLKYTRGIVTDHGGKTCHAAQVAMEKGIVCVVGTGDATSMIEHGRRIHIDARKEKGIIRYV